MILPTSRPRLIPAHAGKTSSFSWLLRRSAAHPHSRGKTIHGQAQDREDRAHPRSHGDNTFVSHRYCVARGSSPLTRGKHPSVLAAIDAVGLIPAHAGKTCFCARRKATGAAHPRSRGENLGVFCRQWLAVGSSPLTRGKLPNLTTPHLTHRLIPAHAGKTSRTTRAPTCPPGSSPLTRGKLNDGFVGGGLQGLIPAHAGKTRGRPASSVSTPGSSPLTRGKRKWPRP